MGHCTLRKLFGIYPYSFKDQLTGKHHQRGMAKFDETADDRGKQLLKIVGQTLHLALAIVCATLLFFFLTFTYAPPCCVGERRWKKHQEHYYSQRRPPGGNLLDDDRVANDGFDPKRYYGRPDPLRAWNKGLKVLAFLGFAMGLFICILLLAYVIAFYSPWRPKENDDEKYSSEDLRDIFYGSDYEHDALHGEHSSVV